MKVHGVYNWHDAYIQICLWWAYNHEYYVTPLIYFCQYKYCLMGERKSVLRGVVVKLLYNVFVLGNKNWSDYEYIYGFND